MKVVVLTTILMAANLLTAATMYDVELSDNDNDTLVLAQQSFVATADSISEVAFFCGRKIIPGTYQFRIADSMGSYITDWIESDSAGLYDYELVTAQFNPSVYVRKGFKYSLVVAHTDTFKVNFYYNSTDPYPDGELIGHSGCDLAARIKGVNDFPDMFGCQSNMTIVHADSAGSPYDNVSRPEL